MNETGLLMLIADIREACGDNGKRMHDELVEYIRELKRKADHYDMEREEKKEAGL